MYAQESIDLLQGSGIQFKQHEDDGIEPLYFAELLMTSGIVLMDDVKWVTFHRLVNCKCIRMFHQLHELDNIHSRDLDCKRFYLENSILVSLLKFTKQVNITGQKFTVARCMESFELTSDPFQFMMLFFECVSNLLYYIHRLEVL